MPAPLLVHALSASSTTTCRALRHRHPLARAIDTASLGWAGGRWRACGELAGVAQQRAVLLPQQQQLAAVGARVGAADLVHVGVHDHDLAVHRHCRAPGRRRHGRATWPGRPPQSRGCMHTSERPDSLGLQRAPVHQPSCGAVRGQGGSRCEQPQQESRTSTATALSCGSVIPEVRFTTHADRGVHGRAAPLR